MTNYKVILTLKRDHPGEELAEAVQNSELDRFHAFSTTDHRNRAQIIMDLEASDLPEAAAKAQEILNSVEDRESLQVIPSAEYDRGNTSTPE